MKRRNFIKAMLGTIAAVAAPLKIVQAKQPNLEGPFIVELPEPVENVTIGLDYSLESQAEKFLAFDENSNPIMINNPAFENKLDGWPDIVDPPLVGPHINATEVLERRKETIRKMKQVGISEKNINKYINAIHKAESALITYSKL